ncbi:MAG: hypothetical protein AB7F86_14285 [Bdellovibrionales bacterium]
MVNDEDRGKILALVHSELEPVEADRLRARMEKEADLRAEFDSLAAVSDDIEELLTRPATDDLSDEQQAKILGRKKSRRMGFFLAAASAMAAGLVAVLMLPPSENLQNLEGADQAKGIVASEPVAPLDGETSQVAAPPPQAVSALQEEMAGAGNVASPDNLVPPAQGPTRLGGLSGRKESREEMPAHQAEKKEKPKAKLKAKPKTKLEKQADTLKKSQVKITMSARQKRQVVNQAPSKGAVVQSAPPAAEPPSAEKMEVGEIKMAPPTQNETVADSADSFESFDDGDSAPAAQLEKRSHPDRSRRDDFADANEPAMEAESDSLVANESVADSDNFVEGTSPKPFGSSGEGSSAPAPAPAPAEPAPATPAEPLRMGVYAKRAQFSKNLDRKKALHFIQVKLDGKVGCLPPGMAEVKVLQASIRTKADGSIVKISTQPSGLIIADCLRSRLGNTKNAFRSKNGKPGSIILQIKNFAP